MYPSRQKSYMISDGWQGILYDLRNVAGSFGMISDGGREFQLSHLHMQKLHLVFREITNSIWSQAIITRGKGRALYINSGVIKLLYAQQKCGEQKEFKKKHWGWEKAKFLVL
jgi:hypothetical protein